MTVERALLFNGTDISSLVRAVTRLDLYAPGTRRGSSDVIPGRRGQLGAVLPYDAYAFSVGVLLDGSDEPHFIANLRALGAALASPGGLGTLERRLPDTSGGYDAGTADGQFLGGLSVTLLNPMNGETELQFVNLSGAWLHGSSWLVP